jgi:putative membrane protein
MSEITAPSAGPDPRVRLAYERTYLAIERTQMGWVRTALSLISFGFAIAKFFQYLHEQHPGKEPLLAPRTVGILMIVIGLVALLLADLQHRQAIRLIRKECPGLPYSLAGPVSVFIALLGILALLGALFRQ